MHSHFDGVSNHNHQNETRGHHTYNNNNRGDEEYEFVVVLLIFFSLMNRPIATIRNTSRAIHPPRIICFFVRTFLSRLIRC